MKARSTCRVDVTSTNLRSGVEVGKVTVSESPDPAGSQAVQHGILVRTLGRVCVPVDDRGWRTGELSGGGKRGRVRNAHKLSPVILDDPDVGRQSDDADDWNDRNGQQYYCLTMA